MEPERQKASRKPRADSIKNRERLLEAATAIFSAGGPQASLEAVARQAGVGIGTLYRHFPTREALFEAVYRHEVELLAELAERLVKEKEPVEALRTWLHATIRLVATKKGMIEALQLAAHGSSELKAYTYQRMVAAVAQLMTHGAEAGTLRADIPPDELLNTLFGILYAQGPTNWQPAVMRMVDVFVDGLRVR